MAKKSKKNKSPPAPEKEPESQPVSGPPLQAPRLISRNRHWPFICCFQGDWLKMPLDFLEVTANVSYQFPRPRFIDPPVVYDLVKVRRLVEEAANLASLASSHTSKASLSIVNKDSRHAGTLLDTDKKGRKVVLSAERKFTMRVQAVQRLARAYRLDEFACIVAVAEYPEALKNLAELVLQRDPEDLDARYVHMFHERIPGGTVQDTSLEPLDDIILHGSLDPANWRTRGLVKLGKGENEAAIVDLSSALTCFSSHQSYKTVSRVPKEQPRARVQLAEDEQPSSLVGQLLFLRGWAYLCASCDQVRLVLNLPQTRSQRAARIDRAANPVVSGAGEQDDMAPYRKVKALAKRSLNDIMDFLVDLDYSPNLSLSTVREFSDRTAKSEYGNKRTRHTERSIASHPCTVYRLADLFCSMPPSDLPPYPCPPSEANDDTPRTTCEAVTAHPMLTEALHVFLLAHCLLQTDVKEIERLSYMVARIIRLVDGSPVFLSNKSPGRDEWSDVLTQVLNWVKLDGKWDDLCWPNRITPENQPEPGSDGLAIAKVESRLPRGCPHAHTSCCHQVHDPIGNTADASESAPEGPPESGETQGKPSARKPFPASKPPSGRGYAIAQWIIRAPFVKGVARKKKKKASKTKAAGGSDGMAEEVLGTEGPNDDQVT